MVAWVGALSWIDEIGMGVDPDNSEIFVDCF